MATTPQAGTPAVIDRGASVMTEARWEQGLTYADFFAQAPVNHDKLEAAYKSCPLSDEDISFFKAAAALPGGPAKMMAIAESWCPDVCRELPIAVRISEGTGLPLRIFIRDQNPDVMDEFVSNNGQSRAMPVVVFYTADMRYLGHFTERSKRARTDLAFSMEQAKAELNLPASATFATLQGAERQAFIHAIVSRINPLTVDWQRATIQEMRQILADALSLPNSVESQAAVAKLPIVYTIRGCESCMKLMKKWDSESKRYEERRVELNQATLEEARKYGEMVPIVVYPDGRVEEGFEGAIGCFL